MNGRFAMSNYNTYNPSSPFKLSISTNKDSTASQSNSDINVHLSFLTNNRFINPYNDIHITFSNETNDNDNNVNYLKKIYF